MKELMAQMAKLRPTLADHGNGSVVDGAIKLGLLTREDLRRWEIADLKRYVASGLSNDASQQ